MTREEAITILKDISWQMGSVKRWENIEAIDMAIEALQREDTLLKSLETNEPLYTEVVRCKDCRYYDESCEVCRCPQWDLSRTEYPKVKANGFCSYGEASDED